MNILKIAAIVASEEQTAYNKEVWDKITPQMYEDFSVSPSAQPFESGINSAVFINDSDNIVVYSAKPDTYNTALRLEGKKQAVLPLVYKVESYELNDEDDLFGTIYAVEMEKLKRPLTKEEAEIFTLNRYKVFFGIESMGWETEIREEWKQTRKELYDRVTDKMIELANRAKSVGVEQIDIHCENVMWDDKEDLRFIDLESINLTDDAFMTQPDAAEGDYDSLEERWFKGEKPAVEDLEIESTLPSTPHPKLPKEKEDDFYEMMKW